MNADQNVSVCYWTEIQPIRPIYFDRLGHVIIWNQSPLNQRAEITSETCWIPSTCIVSSLEVSKTLQWIKPIWYHADFLCLLLPRLLVWYWAGTADREARWLCVWGALLQLPTKIWRLRTTLPRAEVAHTPTHHTGHTTSQTHTAATFSPQAGPAHTTHRGVCNTASHPPLTHQS